MNMIRSRLDKSGRRRGNILIVTLLLLALFATIGLTIVYYTKDLSETQRVNIEAQSNGAQTFADDGSMAFNEFLNNLIFGQPNQALQAGYTNTIVGHDLMRTMYGGLPTNSPGNLTPPKVPWNGVGTFHQRVTVNGVAMDQALLLNLSAMNGQVIPEYTSPANGTYVPKNAPYTYPDIKDLYLASFVPATGEVLTPSFYRPYVFASSGQALGPYGLPATGLEPPGSPNANPNWLTSPSSPGGQPSLFKALICRPRPVDNPIVNLNGPPSPNPPSAFPYPPPNADGTYTGDVQNFVGSYHFVPPTAKSPFAGQYVAYNDSIWIDIGLPPITLLNGKTIKPLVAPLIIDMDALLNYRVHGNNLNNGASTSGAGFGPWEVNFVKAWGGTNSPGDAQTIINNINTNTVSKTAATYSFNSRNSSPIPSYSAVPWTAMGGAVTNSLSLPSQLNGNLYAQTAVAPFYFWPSTAPTYGTGYDSTNSVNNSYAGYTPGQPSTSNWSDFQALMAQYCAPPSAYNNLSGTFSGLTSIQGNASQWATVGSAVYSPTIPYPQSNLPNLAQYPQSPLNINGYRTDPANNNRCLLTPYSNNLDMPGLSPNFWNLRTPTALALNPGLNSFSTGGTLTNPTAAAPFPNPTTTPAGTGDDFSNGVWNNGRAALGPIDLNRPLTDYRLNTGSPLTPGNMTQANVQFPAPKTNLAMPAGGTAAQQAVIDRQQFAMSIFVRLVVASGADASYQVIPGIGESISFPNGAPLANSPAFNALRALAQLAANIVDYIDSDDISTAFVWNPLNLNDPLNALNFASQGAMANSVVFGVEKPRLVLNEAFSEATNDPTDPALNNPTPPGKNAPVASKNPYIRFWVELTNPSTQPYTNNNGPLGTGMAKVYYNANDPDLIGAPYGANAYPAYLIQTARSLAGAANVSDVLRDPANLNNVGNVTGAFIGANADLTFDFSPAANVFQATVSPGSTLVCAPAPTNAGNPTFGQTTGAPDWNTSTGGNWTFGPQPPNPASPTPTSVTTITAGVPGNGATNSLTYNNIIPLANAIGGNRRGMNHNVILLRRLANPYLPPNDPTVNTTYNNPKGPINPYITVDFMDYVPSTDQILMANNSAVKRKSGAGGYPSNPASLGKVQPYAAWTPPGGGGIQANTGTYNFTFPTSLVLPQQPIPNQQLYTQPPVNNTFGYLNTVTVGTPLYPPQNNTYTPGVGLLTNPSPPPPPPAKATQETIMLPYNWLTHMDRPLINQIELFQVAMGKPHELTQRFIVPSNTTNDVTPYGYMAATTFEWANNPNNPNATPNMLYRALDVLRIKPYIASVPLGGQYEGRINLNMVQDKRVFDGLLDAQSWNGFTPPVTSGTGDVSKMWNTMIGSRTAVMQPRYTTMGNQLTDSASAIYNTPIPGASVYDSTTVGNSAQRVAGTDRPFLPFSAPTFAAGGFAYPAGSGLYFDTLLRNGTQGIPAGPAPFITTATNSGPHPYQQIEALRKIMNNTTTVSHTFAVWATVGYFDYNISIPANFNNPGKLPAGILGAEYYNQVPGDLRRKYFAVVDRSMVGLNPQTLTLSQAQPNYGLLGGAITAGSNTISTTTTSTTITTTITTNPPTIPPIPPIITTTPTVGFQPSASTPSTPSTVALGIGATQEIITLGLNNPTSTTSSSTTSTSTTSGNTTTKVTTVTTTTTYTYTLPPNTTTKYPHWPGEPVANVIPGNPGPTGTQFNPNAFNYTQAPFNFIVPYTARLQ
jgi:hypothetical protein